MAEVTYLEAIRQGLFEEMERDPNVLVLGEDIATYGGAFKVTKGLLEKFGPNRVVDTPISESLIAGASFGMCLTGLRPVSEMQFADFVTGCCDQLIQMIAKAHYRWGAAAPMVMRLPCGANVHGGPFHSQNPEAIFFNTPGLKMVAPSNPYDAKGLLKAAIRDDNPVLYFEHKYLYRRVKAELPEEDYTVPIGKGAVVKPGSSLSIITYGSTVVYSLEAAQTLAAEGIDVEIVDLRSLLPWDKDIVAESVKKTGRALVLYEATLTGGVGAEYAAWIAEHCFDYLDAPVMRVASLDIPTPFAPELEEAFLPLPPKIVDACRRLAKY
jgi:2-oxoisovalerate dehydrogenase E1 component beta subunit